MPQIPVSRTLREYRASAYRISYPDNWQATAAEKSQGVSLVPREGYVQSGGGAAIGAGAVVDFAKKTGDLRRDTDDLIRQLASENAGMRVQGASKSARVNGQPALITTLQSPSPFAGETEIDTLVTVERPEGLFFVVLIAPQSLAGNLQSTFNAMLSSIRY